MIYVLHFVTHNLKHQEYRNTLIHYPFTYVLVDYFALKLTPRIQNYIRIAALILIAIYIRIKRIQWIQLSADVMSDNKPDHSLNQNFSSQT